MELNALNGQDHITGPHPEGKVNTTLNHRKENHSAVNRKEKGYQMTK
jgi:hypothetical protein